jgi:ketosteroid isomerase-like protein
MRYVGVFLLMLIAAPIASSGSAQSSGDALREQVRAAERAFARSMATRDFNAFSDLVADEAIFYGRDGAQRGKSAVLAGWEPFFNGPTPPFSWAPDSVEVLSSGTLALSSGPVKDPSGKQTGVFNSVWRREAGGRWKVVFDKGCQVCDCPPGQ